MKIKLALKIIRAFGLSVRRSENERRITYRDLNRRLAAAVAYHTTDTEGAVGTTGYMAREGTPNQGLRVATRT